MFSEPEAIRYLQKEMGIPAEDTYAFGDGWNDLSMFEACGHKIAVGNAVDPLKEKADYISADCLQGGVIQGLLHAGLLDKEDFIQAGLHHLYDVY